MVENSNIKIQKAKSSLLLIGMFSVVMLFAGLTSAYIVSKGALGSSWDVIQLPKMFYFSTMTIIMSSIFGYFSLSYCREDNFLMVSRYLLFTILFGVFFFLFQILGP